MEGLRVVLAIGFFGFAAFALMTFSYGEDEISVTGAMLSPMGEGFALSAKIENPGRADTLVGIGSEAAGSVVLVGGETLAIPAGSAPSLAADGAHAMLTGLIGGTEKGRLVQISLWFERSGKITTRARIGGMAMDHDARYPVPEGEPMPDVHLIAKPDGTGWAIEVVTSDFTFSEEAVDGPHQPGVGHGHLYLNGLKLQRMYGPEAKLGALPPGKHQLRVTLNTNDHRAYSIGGGLVSAVAEIEVD